MRVRLRIISDHRQSLGDRAEHVFGEAGGVVGRSAGCDWALPDETKTLSARHATIAFAGGGFVITDTSTNGVYLNSVDAPLGRGATTPLNAGDTLYLGPYAIAVEPIADALDGRQRLGLGDGWMSVRGGGPAPAAGPRERLDDIVGARPGAAPADPLAGFAAPRAAASPMAPRPAAAAVDPLAGLAGSADDDGPAGDLGHGHGLGQRAEEDLLAPSRRPPPAGPRLQPQPPAAALIPPDFAIVEPPLPAPSPPPPAHGPIPTSFLLPEAPAPLPAAARPSPAGRLPPPATPSPAGPLPATPPQPSPRVPLPPVPLPPLPEPPPAARPAEPPAETPPPTDVMALLRLRALAGGAPVPSPAAARADAPAAGGGLLAAIGVDPAALGPREAAAAVEALAAFVLEAADGLVAVLEARRSVKDELRLDHTRLGPTHNNPFKFFSSGGEAVRQIVERRPPGFASLAAGAREGFADIKAHELTTMAAIHAVVAAIVARLSPATIESAGEAGLFGRADKARLWERYVESHGRLAETLDVTVNELIAREFARAYRRRAEGGREDEGRW